MQLFTLNRYTDNSSIFSGYYTSITACIEHAVEQKLDLSYINLKNQNLTNANIDMAHMPHACLNGTNLTGCNLSEANLEKASFLNTSLYNTCLSYSRLRQCNFAGAAFGATLIDGADMRDCQFSTLSCFDLDFHLTHSTIGSTFITTDNISHPMSNTPAIFKGVLNTPIIILDDIVKVGTQYFSSRAIPPLIQHLQEHVLKTIPQQKSTHQFSHQSKVLNG